jgi:hypothetical protein
LAQSYKPPSKNSRACKYWWFDAWDWLVNAVLQTLGPPSVDVGSGEIAIDPHVHTFFSRCSISRPDRIILRAAALGLGGVGILDHSNPGGIGAAEKCADELKAGGLIPQDFVIIPGVEISTAAGHMGALFVRESIPGELSPAQTSRIIREAGGLAVAVHPFHSTGIGEALFDTPIDAVEIHCGSVFSPEQAARTAALVDDPRLASVAKLGASDAHYVNGIGSCYTVLSGAERTPEAVRSALVEGRASARQSDHYIRLQRILGRIPKLH